MALLVCAATARELAALAPGLLPPAEELTEMQPWAVRLKKREALFCVTGVGPVNAALALGFCFGLTAHAGTGQRAMPAGQAGRIDAVLMAGLAGAFDLSVLPLRRLCVVEEEIWPEYGLHDGHTVTARAFSFPLWKRGESPAGSAATAHDNDVYDRLPLDSPAVLGSACGAHAPFTPCRSITVAGVTASFARSRELWSRYHAQLENMEGFAVAYACARAGVPCVEIRSVSNKVGPRNKDEKDFPGALEALRTVLPTLNLL